MNKTSDHKQLQGRGVANVSPFARLSVKPASERPETATFHAVNR